LTAALSCGGDFADLYYEEKESNALLLEAGQVDRLTQGVETGVGLRLLKGLKTLYVYTNVLEEAHLLALATLLARQGSAAVAPVLSAPWRQLSVPNRFCFRVFPDDFAAKKADFLLQIDARIREAFAPVRQVTLGLSDSKKHIRTYNSYGEQTEQTLLRVSATVNVVAAGQEGNVQTAYERLASVSGWEALEETNFEQQALGAAQRACLMLEAKAAPVGEMPVVLSSEAGGTMIHEACGHGLEADHIQKQSSAYHGFLGKKVAAEHITVIDDATLPHEFGSYEFDDEGVAGQRNVLIQDGLLVGHMHDRLSAMKGSAALTGNGRRESYRHKPMPRMSNTLLMPAGADEEALIIKDTKKGLFVRKMGGGQVNPLTGDFVFHVQEAYRIENGVLTAPVRGATLTGNGPEVLKTIDRISSNLGFASGICGKGGQSVPVGDAQPSIRIPALIVGGIG
jgi:TldD protein